MGLITAIREFVAVDSRRPADADRCSECDIYLDDTEGIWRPGWKTLTCGRDKCEDSAAAGRSW